MSTTPIDIAGLDKPELLYLQAVLPPLIALREVVEAKGGSVRVSLRGPREIFSLPMPPRPEFPGGPIVSEGSNPFDPPETPDARDQASVEAPPAGEANTGGGAVLDVSSFARLPEAFEAFYAALNLSDATETVAPMQTSPEGAAATDDPAEVGVAAPVAAGHPLPATSSPDAVKPAPAVVSSPAAGATDPADRLAEYLLRVPRRGPWTVREEVRVLTLWVDRWKLGEIAEDVGIDAAAVRHRIKILTDDGKWEAAAVLQRLEAMA